MVESSPSCQRLPPCKTTKGMLDESAFLGPYLPTYLLTQMAHSSETALQAMILPHTPFPTAAMSFEMHFLKYYPLKRKF